MLAFSAGIEAWINQPIHRMQNPTDQEASVVVEPILYPTMTQADLDEAIQRQYVEFDDSVSLSKHTKMGGGGLEDEGYSSPTSPPHSQYASPVSESTESPDWNIDQTVPEEEILDLLFPSLVELCDIPESGVTLLNEFLFRSDDVCGTEKPTGSSETSTGRRWFT